jgi:two-component system, NarL family, sensor kinase
MRGGQLPGAWPFKLAVSEASGPQFDPPSGSSNGQGDPPNSNEKNGEARFDPQPHADEPDFSVANSFDSLLKIHEYERKRLGQELHDATGQLLVSLQSSISLMRNLAEESGQGKLIEEIRETISQIDQQIRSLAFLEYPVELGDRDLFSAVQLLTLGFGRRTGVDTSFKVIGEVAALGAQTSKAILRIVQEALVNVHRHSRATSAKVQLTMGRESLQLTITDNGIGVADRADVSEGLGLRGMRHRAEELGGSIRISNLKHGTKISVTVPLR